MTLIADWLDQLLPVSPARRKLVLAWLLRDQTDGPLQTYVGPLLPPRQPPVGNASALPPPLARRLHYIVGPPPPRIGGPERNASAARLPSSVSYSPFIFTCRVTAPPAPSAGRLIWIYWRDTVRLCESGEFDERTQMALQYGDTRIETVSGLPADVRLFAKSRQLVGTRQPAAGQQRPVLLPLGIKRHFGAARMQLDSYVPWARKRPSLVWRGSTTGFTTLRRDFVDGLANHPNLSRDDVDVRFTSVVQGNDGWVRGAGAPPLARDMSRLQMMGFRYVLSLEGNDVASNLKWLLGHNSVVVMPRPTAETWLLEGLLRPWVHYVPVRGAAEVPAALAWMRANEPACLRIVANANAWLDGIMRDTARTAAEVIRQARIGGAGGAAASPGQPKPKGKWTSQEGNARREWLTPWYR